jgi:hypothetical protein
MAKAAPRHPQHQRNRSAPSVANLRCVVHQLIEAGRNEIVELHFPDRPLPRKRRADADTDYRPFGKGRIEDAIAELLQQWTEQKKRIAVIPPHIFPEDEDSRIAAECVAHAHHDGLEEGAALRVHRGVRLEEREC